MGKRLDHFRDDPELFSVQGAAGRSRPGGVEDPRLTAEAQEAIRVRFGLDKPVINCFESINPPKLGSCLVNPLDTQFFIYIKNLLQGDLGISYHTNRPVKDMIGDALVNTIILIGFGQMIAIFLGMALGLIAAWKANTPSISLRLGSAWWPGRCQPSGWASCYFSPAPPGWGCRLLASSPLEVDSIQVYR